MPATLPFEVGEIEVEEPSGQVVTRYYGYIEPDQNTPDPLPLVLIFHGGGGNMSVIANQLGFDSVSPRPYLTVFLQGDGPSRPNTPLPPNVPTDGLWNCGHMGFRGPLAPYERDDVAFFDAILLEVTRRAATSGWRIDQSRTYAIGYSNGAMMTYRLAAERSAELAAVAVIAGSIGGHPDPDDPSAVFHVNDPGSFDAEPVSVIHFHGLLDGSVPFLGGLGEQGVPPDPRSDMRTIDAIDLWVDHNDCAHQPTVDSYHLGTRRTWSDGDDDTEVQLLLAPGIGHQVPDDVMELIEPFLASHAK